MAAGISPSRGAGGRVREIAWEKQSRFMEQGSRSLGT